MPRCKNCPPSYKGYYYTEKENTPLGNGWSAKFVEPGKRMKGKDGKYYQSNGEKWIKVKITNPRGAFYNMIKKI